MAGRPDELLNRIDKALQRVNAERDAWRRQNKKAVRPRDRRK